LMNGFVINRGCIYMSATCRRHIKYVCLPAAWSLAV